MRALANNSRNDVLPYDLLAAYLRVPGGMTHGPMSKSSPPAKKQVTNIQNRTGLSARRIGCVKPLGLMLPFTAL